MECNYSKGFVGIFKKVEEIKEKTIKTLMNENCVRESDLESGRYKIKVDNRNTNNQKFILLLDHRNSFVDGYRMEFNFGRRDAIRVEVFKI